MIRGIDGASEGYWFGGGGGGGGCAMFFFLLFIFGNCKRKCIIFKI